MILTQQFDWLKRQLFGRKGEQLDHPDLFGGQEPGETPASRKKPNSKRNPPTSFCAASSA